MERKPLSEAPSRLAGHAWWRGPIASTQVEAIAAAIASLQRHHDRGELARATLVVHPNGQMDYVSLDGPSQVEETMGLLQGAGENTVIQFISGKRGAPHLSLRKAEAILAKMLDAAHASETKFKKTGRGDSLIDQLLDLQPEVPKGDPK